MKIFLKNILSGLIIGFTAFSVIYASLSSVNTGDTLKSDDWNEIVAEVNSMPGMIVAFSSTTCPSGWYPADGSVDNLDLRGVFIRGANDFGTGENNRDVDRANAGSGVLSEQGDAIRNISWFFRDIPIRTAKPVINLPSNGVRYGLVSINGIAQTSATNMGGISGLTTKDVVPTGLDNRPKNIALIYCVKE